MLTYCMNYQPLAQGLKSVIVSVLLLALMEAHPGPLLKKRKGGVQQRIAGSAADEVKGPCRVLLHLLYKIAWGFMQMAAAVELARLELLDIQDAMPDKMGHFPYPDLWEIADPNIRIVTAMKRLVKVINRTPTLPSPFRVELPFASPIGRVLTSMILPHQLFSYIYNNRPTVWKATLCPSESLLQRFWQTNAQHPQMEDHPVKLKTNWKSRAIPIAIHGDEVPVLGRGKCWSKSFLNFSWYGLLAFCSMGLCTADYVFWIWGVFDTYLETENADTIDEFLVVLCWSLQALFSGKHPTHDHRGLQHFGLPLFVVLAGRILFVMKCFFSPRCR